MNKPIAQLIFKALSPVFYGLLFFPAPVAIWNLLTLSWKFRTSLYGLSINSRNMEFFFYLALIGTAWIFLLGLGNFVINKVEKHDRISLLTHFRQSFAYYLLAAWAAYFVLVENQGWIGGPAGVAVITVVTISTIAILTNAVYLFYLWQKKELQKTKPL